MPYKHKLEINEAQQWHRQFIEKMGWCNTKSPLESVALIHEEAAELGHELRQETIDMKKVANEGADIILRTMDLLHELGIDVGGAVFDKIAHNHDNVEAIKAKGRKI